MTSDAALRIVDGLEIPAVERPSLRDKIVSGAAILAMEEPPALVEGLIPVGGLALIYGLPKTLKSYVSLDLALSVVHGAPWGPWRTERGGVLYCALEGAALNRRRLAAWLEDRKLPAPATFHLYPDRLQLQSEGVVSALIDAIVELRPALVIIDTVARAMVGLDESTALGMGVFVEQCDRIRQETGATVLLVHHAGKNLDRGARGSNSLLGAVDTELLIERAEHIVKVTPTATKGYAEPPPNRWQTRVVELNDGTTNLVLDHIGAEVAGSSTGAERIVLELLTFGADGEPLSPSTLKRLSEETGSRLPDSTLRRALKALHESGQIERHGKPARPTYLAKASRS